MTVKVWVDLGGALAEAWLLAYFLHVLLGRMRWRRQWNLLGYGLLTFLVWVGSMRLDHAYTLMLANMLLYVVMAVWGYRGKLATKAFAGVFYLLLSLIHICYQGKLHLQCDEESFTFTAIMSNANRS